LNLSAAFFQTVLRKRCFRPYKQAKVDQHLLLFPLTYMNNSGLVCRYVIPRRYTVDQLIVMCDTLDLPAGMIRVRQGGSSAGQKGLQSIIDELGSADFTRIYIGIGRPKENQSVIEHVLGKAQETEERRLLQQGIQAASSALITLLEGATVGEVAGEYNRKNSHS